MYKFPIGVMLESFRMPFDDALDAAHKMGANGIQLYATNGENTPENLNLNARKELLKKLTDRNMVFSAICGDFGKGFGDPEQNKIYIEKSKRVIDLAKDLGTNIVTTHIGVVPSNKNNPRYKIMQDACGELSDYAKSMDAYFAVETGPETAVVLKEFLDTLSGAVRVNLDPANFKMVTGDDPVQAVYTLKDYIVHTHAKDGVKYIDVDPEIVYHVVHPIPEEFQGKVFFKEVPLGEGSVPFEAYLKALDDIGYKGFLTIEREVGENPVKDIQTAYNFLKNLEEK